MNYTVKSGDSLSRIAANVLGNFALWPQIASLNNLAAPYVIFPGQVLQLPASGSAPAASAGQGGSNPTPASLMPAPVSVTPLAPATMPGSGGGIMQWIQNNKLMVGGGIAVIAIIALAMGSRKKGKKRQVKARG